MQFVIGHVLQAAYQEAALILFFLTLFKDQMTINYDTMMRRAPPGDWWNEVELNATKY
jgi:hypothetical protein